MVTSKCWFKYRHLWIIGSVEDIDDDDHGDDGDDDDDDEEEEEDVDVDDVDDNLGEAGVSTKISTGSSMMLFTT